MELWDLYTANRQRVGETHIRGNELPEDRYHLVVHAWLKNPEGKYLLTQRSPNRKRLPLTWECTCGSVLKGENSQEGAVREIAEEVGIILDPQIEPGTIIYSCLRKTFGGKKYNDILDVWMFETQKDPDLTHASTAEVSATQWLTPSEIRKLWKEGKMNPEMEYFFSEIAKEK